MLTCPKLLNELRESEQKFKILAWRALVATGKRVLSPNEGWGCWREETYHFKDRMVCRGICFVFF